MKTEKPLQTIFHEQLLAAAHEDEQLELCDALARGDKTAAAVDAALGWKSPRLQRLRQMSEPLTSEQKAKLVAQLLQPAPAQAAPTELSAVPSDARTRRPSAPRSRRLGIYAAGLALAASLAVYVAWSRDNAPLPALALEVVEHHTVVLAAPTPTGPSGLQVHLGSCLDLRLRPERSHDAELQTAVWLVAEGADAAQRPLPWPVQLHATEKGMLQLETCEPLPGAVGPGNWQLAVMYGRELPPASAVGKALAETNIGTQAAKFRIVRQPLQVMDSPP